MTRNRLRSGEDRPARRRALMPMLSALACALMLLAPARLDAQETIQSEAVGVISIPRGGTAIISRPDSIRRISIADPSIADAVVFPPSEILINAQTVGSTSLVLWGASTTPRIFTIEVTADVESLRRQLNDLFPDSPLDITTTGNAVVLSGEVRDPAVVRRTLELANTLGVPVINNLQAPAPEQILLHVEFAEVARSAVKEFGGSVLRVLNPQTLDHAFDQDDTQEVQTLTEGLVTIAIAGNGSELDAVIRALKTSGEFKSLAEPNLVAVEGQEATFLAGGEFPFPTVQASGGGQVVTITWKEFGIRLNFTPTITNIGNVRLTVAPEVSSLDFANGLTFQGFQIPSVLARRVTTEVELRHGQTLAIGGLLDHTMTDDVSKIPILGDIPILGFFFKSQAARQNRTELLVLVTPYILDPNALPAPPLPTEEPEAWDWDGFIGDWIRSRPDSVTQLAPLGGRQGGV